MLGSSACITLKRVALRRVQRASIALLCLTVVLSNRVFAASDTPPPKTEQEITALKTSLKRVIDDAVLNKLRTALFLPSKAEPFSTAINLHFAPTGEILDVEAKVSAKTKAFEPNLEVAITKAFYRLGRFDYAHEMIQHFDTRHYQAMFNIGEYCEYLLRFQRNTSNHGDSAYFGESDRSFRFYPIAFLLLFHPCQFYLK